MWVTEWAAFVDGTQCNARVQRIAYLARLNWFLIALGYETFQGELRLILIEQGDGRSIGPDKLGGQGENRLQHPGQFF